MSGICAKENKMASQDFSWQLAGYGLTTAHILYRRPDHPWLLQSYVWQEYDSPPLSGAEPVSRFFA